MALSEIKQQWPCREAIIEQLAALLSPSLPSPPTLLVHGAHATGKTGIVRAIVEQSGLPNVYVSCEECITERHLFERTIATITSATQPITNGHVKLSRCETVDALSTHLERLIDKKFVLILDGIDRQTEASPFLLPGLARLSETIPDLVLVLITSEPLPRTFRRQGIPHIHFTPYDREQSLQILAQQPLDIFTETGAKYTAAAHEEDKAWLWPRFCAAVWDSLGASAARDLNSFRELCEKLWPAFIEPILQGELGTRNISRLMVAQRKLFQDETALIARIVPDTFAEETGVKRHELPYYAKWLLLAAFLASTNPVRLDAVYFMKSTDKKKRKKGTAVAKAAQQRKIPRHLLAPTPFTLDRLLSILHAILSDDIRTGIDIYTGIATLTNLRLLDKGSGLAASDVLEPGTKWRVGTAVTWDFISRLAGSVDFQLTDYLAE